MHNISKEALSRLREQFPVGARVELTKMNDPYSTKPTEGDRGTVRAVDDCGTIHVSWDCGSSLGVVYGEDACKVVTEEIITVYAPDDDMTFIMKYTLTKNGEPLSAECVGWYHGEPDEEDTERYIGKLKAEYLHSGNSLV